METVESLTEELAKKLGQKASDIEKSVLDCAKKIMRDIGKQFCCEICVNRFKIKQSQDGRGKVRIPAKMMLPLIDVEMDYEVTYQLSSKQTNKLTGGFHVTSQEIVFDNIPEGECKITYYGFYTDKEGGLLIGDIERDAIYQYALYELLKLDVTDPRKDKILLLKQDYRDAVNMARGEYNKTNNARQRTLSVMRSGPPRRVELFEYVNILDAPCLNC